MGLFDFLKKDKPKQSTAEVTKTVLERETASVPVEEKKYYQEDSYYTEKSHEGTIFEQQIISLEERKKTSIPSANGLYVSEILLLEYCSKGTYPNPKNGYPGFWWFQYGIRDVGAALKSLEDRGFITFGSAYDSLHGLTVQQLKDILSSHGQPTTGKKADLLSRIRESVSESDLMNEGAERKYVLTALGEQELAENEYVPYMHSHSTYTTFTVWDLNKMLGTGDKSNYKSVIEQRTAEIEGGIKESNDHFMRELKVIDPEGYKLLKNQDAQIKACQVADEKFRNDKDLAWIITFWEEIWKEGGPKFEGSGWMFRLPDLYIKAKRYDDAIKICQTIKSKRQSYYRDKADSYISRIETMREREK